MPRELVLHAAEALFADASTPTAVSMDDIAAAAGVGKGTLFRAFGSRDGLLDAVFAARLNPLRAEIARVGSPIGPQIPPADRVVGLLELLLVFKLDNPRLIAARELSGSSLLRAPHYRWVHEFLRALIEETGTPSTSADYAAHLLLNGLRADLISELLASGTTREQLLRELTRTSLRLLE
ncbi:MAG TPA: helix-turn-helix domain-containing protein [Lacisediminihabitans sp.]|uniref:TetR/AcrR family transcriptional regulator n=1 Tax=Lacisediminihabitans sp. TaxID=2787631 RepID=UPI002EDB7658